MRSSVLHLATIARTWAATLFVVVLLAACTDSPTVPEDGGISAGDSGPNKDYVLDPVIVIGTPRCNPYLSANFCQGPGTGTCITSQPGEPTDPELITVSSCPGGDAGGGGDGGSSGGDGSTTPPPSTEPPPADTCYTGEPMVDDMDVQGQFATFWNKSLLQGVEMGGWIVRDGTDNYRLIPFHNAVNTPCGVDVYQPPPANVVSVFHTHPWQFGQSRMCDGAYTVYTSTPSPEDVQALQQVGVSTGYFIDHVGVAKYTATGGERATYLDRCAY